MASPCFFLHCKRRGSSYSNTWRKVQWASVWCLVTSPWRRLPGSRRGRNQLATAFPFPATHAGPGRLRPESDARRRAGGARLLLGGRGLEDTDSRHCSVASRSARPAPRRARPWRRSRLRPPTGRSHHRARGSSVGPFPAGGPISFRKMVKSYIFKAH